ncbi:MAG: Eukaryotic translation initiation factor 3 subunit C, partial [Paramarteilia canceri]
MSLSHIICDIDAEYWCFLKNGCTPKTKEYIEGLRISKKIVNLIEGVLEFLEKQENILKSDQTVVRLRMMKHIFYLPASTEKKYPTAEKISHCYNFIQHFSSNGSEKARSTLYYIYYLSLRDDFYLAKHLMLISCIYDDIEKRDIETQILYNHAQ